MAQVSYGTITITDTNDIEKIYMEYAQSTSNQTAPTSGWDTDIPTWQQGKYIWQRTVTKMSGVALSSDSYGEPVCLTGSTGSTGAAGRSVSSIVTTYCNYGDGTPADNYIGWQSTVPAYDSTKPNYWVKTVITYSNPTKTSTTKYKDNGITSATSTAAAANSVAQAANQTANTANNTANNANTKADQAVTNVNNLQNKLKYYWANEVAHTNGVSGWTKPNYPAGTYAASGISGTTFDAENSSTYGYNTWYANGINLRYNAIKLGELTGSALTFYQPSTTTQGAKAMELSGSALKFYASNGTTVQAEFGGSKARVSGTINAYDGQIGNSEDNYWYIGNYLDYFENQSAIIKSHGTASIQLGDSNTWRIATNRIHTAWNNDSSSGDAFKLHFPVYDNKYWDSGLHLPTSANDKLLYIRNSSSSNTLTYLNEALEDQYTNRWNYLFYITNSGSIYAKNIYVLDDNGQATQIGGTDGVYLLKSGGTITGNLTVNGTLTGTLSGTATRVSKDLKIQLNGGTTEGTNQFTYNGGTAKTINITKSSIGLSNVENTALSTWAGSSNLTTTKVGTLAAAAAKGVDTSLTTSTTSTNLPTSAAVVNLIKQYLPLTGGNVTGAVSFGSSVSADELTVGDLVVNGNASFTNNLQANTINGVAVGSSPKFTDTVTTVTVTGNGNAVTSASASNGAVTLTKGATFPTGSGTNGYLTKWTGANTIGNGPALGSDATKFLNNKGEWAVPAGTYTYTLPLATNGTRGGVQIGYTTSGKNYAVQLSNEKMYVNVPWENTTYESKAAASGGTDVSLVTTGEKYTWNQKTSNTGTVTSIATSSPITGGTITGSGTIGHATSGVGNAVTTAGLYKFKYDTYGHVTGVTAIAKADITGLGIPAQDTTYSNASTTTAGLMSAADKKKLDNIQVDSSGQAVAANVAGRWGIDVTFSDTNVAQVGHANSAITASNTQASTVSSATTKTALSFGSIVKLPYVSYDTYGHVTSKSEVYFQLPAAPSSTTSATNATNDSDGNQINTTYIKKSIGTAAGDIIYWSASGTPVRLAKGSNGQVLKLANGVPTWGTDNNDNTWRGIQNNLTSDSTTDSLSAAQGKALANGSARDSTKLPLTGGTMTGAISRAGVSTNWNKGRDNVLIKTTSLSGYSPLWSAKTNNGSWDVGTYGDTSYIDDLVFSYVTDADYANINRTPTQIKFLENGHIVGALDGNATTATSATSATSAEKWTTARNFTIKDSDSTNSGTAVSVDGSAAVTLLLPSTIKASLTGNASTATKWASAQKVYVTLGTASTTTTIQGGSSSAQTIGVNGILGVGNGGTGITAKPSMLTNLGSTTAASVFQTSPRPGITGTLGIANGGTGQTSAKNAANAFLNALDTGSSTPVDADYYISQYVNGGTTTTTYHRRPMSALWNYISGKISSSGTYVTIATDQTITANQKTFNGAIRWGTSSKYGAAHYDSTLEAIVFSFA